MRAGFRSVLAAALLLVAAGLGAQETAIRQLEVPSTKGYVLVLSLGAGPAFTGEVWVDGVRQAKFPVPASSSARQVETPALFLDEGTVTLEFRSRAGPLNLEAVTFRDALRRHTGPLRDVPMDPDATPEARALLKFLVGQSGQHILSGQQDLTWDDSVDMVGKVRQLTGREPAIQGFDFLNYLIPGGDGHRQTEEALAWAARGGLVTFCWHWRVGPERQFYSQQTGFRIPAASDTAGWAALDADLDVVAAQLKRLQDARVPVLWRPLHEASGAWFWWGASGGEAYLRLWRHVYDRLVHVRGLHNLLWVWNAQSPDWYPGDDTVDIVGWDIYGNDRQYLAFPDTWLLAQSVPRAHAKLVTLSENGPIPDPDLLVSQKVPWSWFVTWNDGNQGRPEDDFFSGTKYMDDAFKIRVYNSPYVLTLDELATLR